MPAAVRDQVPSKVIETSTLRGGRVTGTAVSTAGGRMTGDEPGACQRVTGNEYVSADRAAACGLSQPPAGTKVRESISGRGQRVSGARVGSGSEFGESITGAEAGQCSRITGTGYVGMESFTVCNTERRQTAAQAMAAPSGVGRRQTTGTRPLAEGLSGVQRGLCQPVSGTPYQGDEGLTALCPSSLAAEPGEADFPQLIDAALNPPSQAPAVGFGSEPMATVPGRPRGITGPFAGGARVSGDRSGLAVAGVAVAGVAMAAEVDSGVERVTGDASSGRRITGDDWDRGERVTGAEGAFARRNPSRRGAPAGAFAGAANTRVPEDRALPESRVTGSSGNTRAGAAVTVSGGARG